MTNRIIKFRAWNKEINSMGSALPLDVWTDDIATDIGREKYIRDRHNIILMQFTGLFDENGKEIYEGDILQFNVKKKYNHYWVVKFSEKGQWVMERENQRRDIWSNKNENHGLVHKIIGNIYENPELLK